MSPTPTHQWMVRVRPGSFHPSDETLWVMTSLPSVTGPQEELTLEILVRVAPGPVAGARPRPDPAVVERLRRDFGSQGMLCHATRSGLVCTGRREVVGRILGPIAATAGPGTSLPVPASLASVIEQIMVPGLPELFP